MRKRNGKGSVMKTEKQAWLALAEMFAGSGSTNGFRPFGLCSEITNLYVKGETSRSVYNSMLRKISLFNNRGDDWSGYYWLPDRRGNRFRVIAACLCAAMCEFEG